MATTKASASPVSGAPNAISFANVIIPSKGRAATRLATWHHLLAGRIPFTVVVEPQEHEEYQAALTTAAAAAAASAKTGGGARRPPPFSIATLPENDRGVSFARNHILANVAPAQGWFWIMDDDIQRFHRADKGKAHTIPAKELFDIVSQRMAMVDHIETIGIFSLDYQQFCFSFGDDDIAVNSYANIAICLNRERMPQGIRYRFRVREDYDFTLQMIAAGFTSVRFRNLGFSVPRMGTKKGGMTPYYEQQRRDIRLQNKLFLEAWGCVAQEVEKGTGQTHRFDIRVRWGALADRDTAIELLSKRNFQGFSTDPLTTGQGQARPARRVESSTKKNDVESAKESHKRARPNPKVLVEPSPRRGTKAESATSARGNNNADVPAPRVEERARAPGIVRQGAGWVEAKYRHIDIPHLADCGLKHMPKPRVGKTVAYIPWQIDMPVLCHGIVSNVYSKTKGTGVTVIPDRRSDPLYHCDDVFEPVPEDERSATMRRLDDYYAD